MLPKPYLLTLKQSKMITPSVLHLGFMRADQQLFHFIPGQFITLHFTQEDKVVRRSYSVATIPGETDLLEMAVSYVPNGIASEYLFHLPLESQVEATGAFGRLILPAEEPKRYLLVATGTGITPYRAMLPELLNRLAKNPALEVIILQGVRTRVDLLYAEDFLAAARKNPRLQFYVCYSREFLEQTEIYEKQGYVNQVIKELTLDPQNDLVYLCGNPNMIDEVFAYLKEQHFSSENIRREKYISPVVKK